MRTIFGFILAVCLPLSAQSPSVLLMGSKIPPPPPPGLPVSGATLRLIAGFGTFTNYAGTVPTPNGGRVGRWLDFSGATGQTNDLVTTPSGSESRPALSNGVFKGQAGLKFAGQPNRLQSITNNITLGATGATFCYYATLESGSDNTPLLIDWNANGINFRGSGTTRQMIYQTKGNVSATDPVAVPSGSGHCFIGRYCDSTNGIELFKDGTNVVSMADADTMATAGFVCVGSPSGTSVPVGNYWLGLVAEIVTFPYVLSDLQVSNMNNYFTNRYK